LRWRTHLYIAIFFRCQFLCLWDGVGSASEANLGGLWGVSEANSGTLEREEAPHNPSLDLAKSI
jgi:hypothetical protein